MVFLCPGKVTNTLSSCFVLVLVSRAMYPPIETDPNKESRVWKDDACVRIAFLFGDDACVTNNV